MKKYCCCYCWTAAVANTNEWFLECLVFRDRLQASATVAEAGGVAPKVNHWIIDASNKQTKRIFNFVVLFSLSLVEIEYFFINCCRRSTLNERMHFGLTSIKLLLKLPKNGRLFRQFIRWFNQISLHRRLSRSVQSIFVQQKGHISSLGWRFLLIEEIPLWFSRCLNTKIIGLQMCRKTIKLKQMYSLNWMPTNKEHIQMFSLNGMIKIANVLGHFCLQKYNVTMGIHHSENVIFGNVKSGKGHGTFIVPQFSHFRFVDFSLLSRKKSKMNEKWSLLVLPSSSSSTL